MNEIYVNIQCKANGISQVPEITAAVQELRKDYVVKYRLDGRPQANGVVDAIIEIVINATLQDWLLWAGGNIFWNVIQKGFKNLFLTPLVNIFNSLELNACWDYTHVKFTFEDTTVVVKGYSNVFTTKVALIMNLLFKHFDNLRHPELGTPESIIIPITYDDENGVYNNYPDDCYDEAYSEFWGISYCLDTDRRIYDVRNKVLIDNSWTR